MSNPYEGDSNDLATAGLKGVNTVAAPPASHPLPEALASGVWGTSVAGAGVYGESPREGVRGRTTGPGTGVSGSCGSDPGATAVAGSSLGPGTGVFGFSTGGDGVRGESLSNQHAGVSGINDSGGFGVWARGTPAGHFESSKGNCVAAIGTADTDAVVATSSSPNHAAVSAWNNNGGYGLWASSTDTGGQGGIGIYARGAKMAAQFDGSVQCNGDHRCTGTVTVGVDIVLSAAAGDCAEDFELGTECASAEPGTVMILDECGSLRPSNQSYDRKVAGVISGAGEYRPGMILDRRDDTQNRVPLALVGKVFCRADADYGSINVGDLLTTSDTPGHAMKASDPQRAFGAVIGKALRSLESGQGLVPILIALQ